MHSAHAPVVQLPAIQPSGVPREMAVNLSMSDMTPKR